MECNIEAKGRVIRFAIGGAIAIAGAAMLLAAWSTGSDWMRWCALGAFCGAAFCFFEGAAGWCALRAMGVRTRW